MAVQAKAASAVSQTYPTLQAGDLFGIERASVFGKMTWAQFQANDMSLSGSMTVSGTLTVSGATTFNDNVQVFFGTDSDARIFHNGTGFFIEETGSGNMNIRGQDISLQNSDGTAVYIYATSGGGVSSYFNNSVKTLTVNSGFRVTGQLSFPEQASATALGAGFGSIWVKNDTPSSPFFTSDTGVDTKLAGTAINETITGNWTFSGTVALPANTVDTTQIADDAVTIAKIADAALSGADATLVTGTAGTNGNLGQWNADGDLVDGPDVLDEDNMASDSASAVPTQQSVKAYVDGRTAVRAWSAPAGAWETWVENSSGLEQVISAWGGRASTTSTTYELEVADDNVGTNVIVVSQSAGGNNENNFQLNGIVPAGKWYRFTRSNALGTLSVRVLSA